MTRKEIMKEYFEQSKKMNLFKRFLCITSLLYLLFIMILFLLVPIEGSSNYIGNLFNFCMIFGPLLAVNLMLKERKNIDLFEKEMKRAQDLTITYFRDCCGYSFQLETVGEVDYFSKEGLILRRTEMIEARNAEVRKRELDLAFVYYSNGVKNNINFAYDGLQLEFPFDSCIKEGQLIKHSLFLNDDRKFLIERLLLCKELHVEIEKENIDLTDNLKILQNILK